MPLKHTAESVYIAILGIIILLTGIALAILPALPTGIVYFGILLLITILYPLVLFPTFRNNRADYEFRLLHWFPLVMVVLWGLLQVLSKFAYFFAFILKAMLFVWTLPLVFLGLLLLGLFCFSVVRRRTPRIAFLATLFGIFVIAGGLSAAMNWNKTLQAGLTRGPLAIAQNGGSSSSESSSSDTSSSDTIASASSVSSLTPSSSSSKSSKAQSRSSKSSSSKGRSSSSKSSQTSSKPTHLPESGPAETTAIAITLLGLYTAVLHKRQR